MADSDSSLPSSDFNPSYTDSDPSPSSSAPHWFSQIAKARFYSSIPSNIFSICGDYLSEIFSNYTNGHIDKVEFELSVIKLVEDMKPSLEAFKKLLSTANFVPSRKKGKVVFERRSSTIYDKVREELYDHTKTYMKWLKYVVRLREGVVTFPEFRKKMEGIFAKVEIKDLWKELDEEFGTSDEDVDVEKLSEDSSSTGMPSNASDKEPASKRSRTM